MYIALNNIFVSKNIKSYFYWILYKLLTMKELNRHKFKKDETVKLNVSL